MNFVDWRSSTWKTTARSRFAAQRAQVVLGDEAQAGGRVLGHRLHLRARPLDVLGHQLVEEGDEDVLLVAEVEVDGAVGHARPACAISETRAAK